MNIQKRLLNVNFSKNLNQKRGICIHTMVGTLDGTDSHFRNPDSDVSSHYGVDLRSDKIYQWVLEDHTAWAQGNVSAPTNRLVKELGGNPNGYFISIECADDANPHGADRSIQKGNLAQLVADIAQRNNIPLDQDHICGHREIYNKKTCPGNIDVDEIIKLAKQTTEPTELIKTKDSIDLRRKEDVYNGIADYFHLEKGDNGMQTSDIITRFENSQSALEQAQGELDKVKQELTVCQESQSTDGQSSDNSQDTGNGTGSQGANDNNEPQSDGLGSSSDNVSSSDGTIPISQVKVSFLERFLNWIASLFIKTEK